MRPGDLSRLSQNIEPDGLGVNARRGASERGSALHETKLVVKGTNRRQARVWLGPLESPVLAAAVECGGGAVVASAVDANVIIWSTGPDPAALREALHPGIEWVQLDNAGVDHWIAAGIIDRDRVWTSAQGVYAGRVAEHVVALLLAASRRLAEHARAGRWNRLEGNTLAGTTIGFIGGGGIAQESMTRLAPFGVRLLVINRSGRPVPGADRSFPPGRHDDLLEESDYVVLAAPLTQATRGMIGTAELDRIGPTGWLVNVARGQLVDTDALVVALERNRVAGACLDVTDPEPLPEEHRLWSLPNVLITPHVANPWNEHLDVLAGRVAANVERFSSGHPLLGLIDLERGY